MNAETIRACRALAYQQDYVDRIWGLCMYMDLLEDADDKRCYAMVVDSVLNANPSHWISGTREFQLLRQQIRETYMN